MAAFDLTSSMTSGAALFGNFRDNNNRSVNMSRHSGGVNILYEEMSPIDEDNVRTNFSSIIRRINPVSVLEAFTMNKLSSSVRAWLTGRRPATGQQYPRGYYNK
tara:strand:- start:855 stop:1166 length:312 start_codon:yes stop_codon:yes gene_type:complete